MGRRWIGIVADSRSLKDGKSEAKFSSFFHVQWLLSEVHRLVVPIVEKFLMKTIETPRSIQKINGIDAVMLNAFRELSSYCLTETCKLKNFFQTLPSKRRFFSAPENSISFRTFKCFCQIRARTRAHIPRNRLSVSDTCSSSKISTYRSIRLARKHLQSVNSENYKTSSLFSFSWPNSL